MLETKAATILDFIQGLRGTLALTFEEGILAAWLHDLLKPHVSRLVVCDPRKNALMGDGRRLYSDLAQRSKSLFLRMRETEREGLKSRLAVIPSHEEQRRSTCPA